MTSRRVSQLLSGTAIGSALLANLFLFIPLTLFLGNEKEFTVAFNSILGSFTAPIVFLLAIIAIVSILLPEKMYKTFAAVMGVVCLLMWAQGNLFVWDYGLLNGSSLRWDENQLFGWFELAAWVFAIVFVIWKVSQVGEVVVGIAMTLAVLQLGLFGYNYWDSINDLQSGIDLEQERTAANNIFRYSSTENIIHIIADGFQADIIDEILTADKAGEDLSSALTGFTSFRKHIGVFPYTHMSVPALLSGNVYTNHMPLDAFMRTSLGEESIITLAKQNGYEIDLAIPRGALSDIYGNVGPDHLFPVNNGGYLQHDHLIGQDASRLFDYSLFRAVPHHLKRIVYNNQKWFVQLLNKDLIPKALMNFVHMAFLSESSRQLVADREAPVYKLFHLMLSHNPMVTTSDCLPAGRILPTSRENVIAQSRCGLTEIVALLDAIKSAGVYDSSSIIIMGDHGAWVPPDKIKGIKNAKNGTSEIINPKLTALATPFFAVKRPGDQGALVFSDAPSSITDTAKTIASIKNFKNDFDGTSVYELPTEVARERRFMFYEYSKNEWTANRLEEIVEFSIKGDATDSAAWTSVHSYLPNGEVQQITTKSNLWTTVSTIDQ